MRCPVRSFAGKGSEASVTPAISRQALRPAAAATNKHPLYQAAHTLLVRSKDGQRSKDVAHNLATRMACQGRLAVDRKLAVFLHRMWGDVNGFHMERQDRRPGGR